VGTEQSIEFEERIKWCLEEMQLGFFLSLSLSLSLWRLFYPKSKADPKPKALDGDLGSRGGMDILVTHRHRAHSPNHDSHTLPGLSLSLFLSLTSAHGQQVRFDLTCKQCQYLHSNLSMRLMRGTQEGKQQLKKKKDKGNVGEFIVSLSSASFKCISFIP
jgi:hypothetical protein